MTISQRPQRTEDTKEKEWCVVPQMTTSEGKEQRVRQTRDEGSPAMLGNTVWKKLRKQWVIISSCPGSATLMSELFCIQCKGPSDRPPHPGRSHDANVCQMRPERTKGWGIFHKNVSVPLELWQKNGCRWDTYALVLGGWRVLTGKTSALLEGHFIIHRKAKLVRGEKEDFL